MRIALLHTADIHVATFDRIFKDIGVDVQCDHHVDASLLDVARHAGLEAARADVLARLDALGDADAVLCTCSTLGPLVDEAAKSAAHIIRIDRPLMEKACADSATVLVALCLDSTRDASLDLLQDCAKTAGKHVNARVVVCADAWAFLEAGDMGAYAASIARSVKTRIATEPDIACIILAQASMQVAEAELADTGLAVFSAPVLAAERCMAAASARTGMRE